ncbi:ABC transporter permease [Dactylosporangium sp. CA-092794]|uniref:ABC transporter permease n=1 Tax=Dactylosporangium sp. CA-092794 TaxID=3239929 RepID=UPI003D92848B
MSVASEVDVTTPPAAAGPGPGRALAARAAGPVLLLPAVVAFALLFLYPLGRIVYVSLTEPAAGFGNYADVLGDGYTVRIVLRTIWVALLVTLIDLVMAFPFAYAMTITGPRVRAVLFTIVLIPFWTSAIAKNFAWLVLLQSGGPVDRLLGVFGVHHPLIGTTQAVVVAMSQVLLPFAVLPLYARLDQIDRRLLDAAQGLGATRAGSFRQVYLPLSVPGVASAATLTFILSLGFYITPAMLGSAQQTLIAQLVMIRVQQVLDYPGADAIGIFLLLVTLAMLLLSRLLSARAGGGGAPGGRDLVGRIGRDA